MSLNPGWVKSKTEKLAPVASLISVYHLRPRAGLVGPASVYSDWVGYHVYLRHGTSVCWQLGEISCLSEAWFFGVLVCIYLDLFPRK